MNESYLVTRTGLKLQDGPLEVTRSLVEEATAPACPILGRGHGLVGGLALVLISTKPRKLCRAGAGAGGAGACPGLSCFCLASIVTSPPGLVCLAGCGPPGLPFTRRGHLLHLHSLAETFQLSHYIPFTKKKKKSRS